MISSQMLAVVLNRAISIQAVVLAIILMLGIALYLFDKELALLVRLAAFLVSLILLTSTHLWLPGLKLQSGHILWFLTFVTLVFTLLGSILVISIMVFETGLVKKWLVTLMALQSMHFVLYGVNWFFFSERKRASRKSPTAMDLARSGRCRKH